MHYTLTHTHTGTQRTHSAAAKWHMNRYMLCCLFDCLPVPLSACLWAGCRNPTSRQVKYTARTGRTQSHTHTHTQREVELGKKREKRVSLKWQRGPTKAKANMCCSLSLPPPSLIPLTSSPSISLPPSRCLSVLSRIHSQTLPTNNNNATIVCATNKLLLYVCRLSRSLARARLPAHSFARSLSHSLLRRARSLFVLCSAGSLAD